MHKSHHEPPDTSLGFEQSDISIPGIAKGVVGYFIFTIGIGLVVFVGMIVYGAANPPPADQNRRLPPPPNPILQNGVNARTDIWNLRSREDFLLHNVTWVDEKKGVVRVPIDAAIDQASRLGPAALSTAQKGPEEGGVTPPTGLPSIPVQSPSGAKPPNTSAGSEFTASGHPLAGPGARRVTAPEGAKPKQ